MKIVLTLTGIGLLITSLFGLFWFFMPGFSDRFSPPKIIMVKATLENRCSVIDQTFVAEAPEQGRRAQFRDGVAVMRLPEGATIQLAVSSAYPAFRYDDMPQPVAPNIKLVADCDVSPRLQSIFGSMKKQFKQ
jgi:hypothetical protein